MIDLFDVQFFSFAWLSICRREIFEELLKVAFVIAQRVRADVALIAQMVQKWSTKLMEHAARGAGFSVRSRNRRDGLKSLLYTRSWDFTRNPLRARTRALGCVFTVTAITWKWPSRLSAAG